MFSKRSLFLKAERIDPRGQSFKKNALLRKWIIFEDFRLFCLYHTNDKAIVNISSYEQVAAFISIYL